MVASDVLFGSESSTTAERFVLHQLAEIFRVQFAVRVAKRLRRIGPIAVGGTGWFGDCIGIASAADFAVVCIFHGLCRSPLRQRYTVCRRQRNSTFLASELLPAVDRTKLPTPFIAHLLGCNLCAGSDPNGVTAATFHRCGRQRGSIPAQRGLGQCLRAGSSFSLERLVPVI